MSELPEGTERAFKQLVEWKIHPEKFLEGVRISDPQKGTVDFELWPHLVELWSAFQSERLLLIPKARQIGISWLAVSHAIRTILTKPNARALFISRGEREAGELLDKATFLYRNLEIAKTITLSHDSTTVFGIKELDSRIVALPCTATAGIGEAATVVVCDEWDKWGSEGQDPRIQEKNYAALKPTIDAGGQLIGISTVNKEKPDSFFKQLIRGALAGKNNFKLFFYGCMVRPGRDEAWFKQIEMDMPPWMREQEYPKTLEEALSSLSAHSFFDKDALKRLFDGVIEPIENRGHGVYILHPPRVGVTYVAGADIGEGVGLSASTLTIAGLIAGQIDVAAVIYSNQINVDLFAYQSFQLLKEYFNPLLAAENNGLGLAYINKIVELGYKWLFSSGKKPGLTITGKNRETSLLELGEAIRNGSLVTQFKPQVLELFDFIWKLDAQGQTARPKGSKHDDLVFSLCHMYQMAKKQLVNITTPIRISYPKSWQGRT